MKKRIAKKFWKEFYRLNPDHDPKVKIMSTVPRGSYGWPTLKRAVARWNVGVSLHKRCLARKPHNMGKWEVKTFTWVKDESTGVTNETTGSWVTSLGVSPDQQAAFQAQLKASQSGTEDTSAMWVKFTPGPPSSGEGTP